MCVLYIMSTHNAPFIYNFFLVALYEINRARVVQSMLDIDNNMKGVILLQGGKQTTRYDTDHDLARILRY